MKKICTLMLSYSCNLNCVYCFEKCKSNAPNKQMNLALAKKIIKDEFRRVAEDASLDSLKLDLFGGEPFVRFDVLKDLCEWVWRQKVSFPVEILITTNGTLLTAQRQAWLRKNKERLSVCMSIDGDAEMQLRNRGTGDGLLPTAFVHECFPRQPFKMTLSRDSLKTFAKGYLHLVKQGYVVDARPATEEDWYDDSPRTYQRELMKIAKFYLSHLEQTPSRHLLKLFNSLDVKPARFCGAGTHMSAYDYDGREFPCHMFTRIVNGDLNVDLYGMYDFERPILNEAPPCSGCKLLYLCPTCIGNNLQNRGDVTARDLRTCGMYLAETKVISRFQILYFTAMSKRRPLVDEEKLKLQRALPVFGLVRRLRFGCFQNGKGGDGQ